jgi:hypothetical protein
MQLAMSQELRVKSQTAYKLQDATAKGQIWTADLEISLHLTLISPSISIEHSNKQTLI